MVKSRSVTLSQKVRNTVNGLYQQLISVALIAGFMQWSAAAQSTLPPEPASTNLVPEVTPPVEIAPVVTNQIPALTNQIPTLKPKAGVKSSGANVLGALAGGFDSKYSVSGRTLKFPVPEATPHSATSWRRNLDFGMNMAKGNSDTLRYSLGVNTVKAEDANTIRFRAQGTYGESAGIKDTENATALIRYDRQLTAAVYALGNIAWMTDPMSELDYRFTGILSPGVHLLHSQTALLNLEIGGGYVEEKKDGNENGYAAGRAAVTAEKLINEHVLSWAAIEYIPKLADPSVYFINSEIGLASYITRDLSLNVCYMNRYDSAPGEDIKSSDTLLSTAISLNF